MMNKRLNNPPVEEPEYDDLDLDLFYFDDDDEYSLPYESAMEP